GAEPGFCTGGGIRTRGNGAGGCAGAAHPALGPDASASGAATDTTTPAFLGASTSAADAGDHAGDRLHRRTATGGEAGAFLDDPGTRQPHQDLAHAPGEPGKRALGLASRAGLRAWVPDVGGARTRPRSRTGRPDLPRSARGA